MQERRCRTLVPAALEATRGHGVVVSIAVALQDPVRHEISELDLMIIVRLSGGTPGKAVETRSFQRALLKVVYTDIGDVAVPWEAKNDLIRGETCLCPGMVSGYCVLGWLTGVSTPIVQGCVRTGRGCSCGFTVRQYLSIVLNV